MKHCLVLLHRAVLFVVIISWITNGDLSDEEEINSLHTFSAFMYNNDTQLLIRIH